ncbi:CoA transferase [Fodinicola feengrottensis]|nr:CoA transferase [Fodinicola feengrottensis]
MSLTDRLAKAAANPATDDDFDPRATLAEVLAGIGVDLADTGGSFSFQGADPVVPSTLRLGAASAIALAAKSATIAKLWRLRGGPGQHIGVDLRVAPHRLCPFYDRKWELLNGYPPGSPANATNALGLAFYRTADDRWVMPLNLYPKIKVAAQKLLNVPDDADAVAAAVARWRGRELEEAGAAAGVVMPMLRSTEELLTEPHYRDVLADLPLIEITKIGDSEPVPLPPGAAQPLSGVRALGMGHVIAGAGVGRALALHGADVLNLWRPYELEHDVTYASANVGTRSATVDPRSLEGKEKIHALLAGADVFYANRRPGYLDQIGLSPQEAAAVRPGIIHATASLNGPHGPWADRVGFDQTAGSLVGMMTLEGGRRRPARAAADHGRQRLRHVVADGRGHCRGTGPAGCRRRQLPRACFVDPGRIVDPQHGHLRPAARAADRWPGDRARVSRPGDLRRGHPAWPLPGCHRPGVDVTNPRALRHGAGAARLLPAGVARRLNSGSAVGLLTIGQSARTLRRPPGEGEACPDTSPSPWTSAA